jgi:hypothetical protein
MCQAMTTSFRAVATTATFRFFRAASRRKNIPGVSDGGKIPHWDERKIPHPFAQEVGP